MDLWVYIFQMSTVIQISWPLSAAFLLCCMDLMLCEHCCQVEKSPSAWSVVCLLYVSMFPEMGHLWHCLKPVEVVVLYTVFSPSPFSSKKREKLKHTNVMIICFKGCLRKHYTDNCVPKKNPAAVNTEVLTFKAFT